MSGPSTRKSHPQARQKNRWKVPSTIAWTISGTRGPLRLTATDSTRVVPHAGQATVRSRNIDMRGHAVLQSRASSSVQPGARRGHGRPSRLSGIAVARKGSGSPGTWSSRPEQRVVPAELGFQAEPSELAVLLAD